MPAQQGFKYFTIKIKPEFHQDIKEYCVKEGMTMRDFAIQSFEMRFAVKDKDESPKTPSMDNHGGRREEIQKS